APEASDVRLVPDLVRVDDALVARGDVLHETGEVGHVLRHVPVAGAVRPRSPARCVVDVDEEVDALRVREGDRTIAALDLPEVVLSGRALPGVPLDAQARPARSEIVDCRDGLVLV